MSISQKSQKAHMFLGRAFNYLEVFETPVEIFMPKTLETASSHDPKAALLSGASSDRRLEIVPVSRLIPYKGNARTHTKKQIRQIADSITHFGFTNPVLIDDADEIIAGHGRVEAAKLLGLSGVPALRLSHLSDAEKRAYVLADNRLAEKAGWDHEILAIELSGLIELDFEVELTGFETPEIDLIIEEANESKDQSPGPEDDRPELLDGPSVSQPGDLWVLGKHRVLCDNALDQKAYERLLDGDKAEFVFADPPYNVRIDGHVCGKGAIRHREFAMASGEMTQNAFTSFLAAVFRHLVANSADGSIHDICMDWRHIAEIIAAGNQAYTELKNLCVWKKTNAGMGSFYRSQHELVFVWKSGTAPHINNFELGQHGRHRTNVWEYPGISSMRPGRLDELGMHPTVKPIALVADAIKDCSRRNGIVLDPFLGSGTTVIASERTGRRARGIEIDSTYVDVVVRRWQTFTGKTATLAATEQSFEEVKEARAHSSSLALQDMAAGTTAADEVC